MESIQESEFDEGADVPARIDLSTGQRIAWCRQTKELSQTEFAAAIGVHANQVSRYEHDLQVPGGEVLRKMAVTLGTSTDFLLRLKEQATGRYLSPAPDCSPPKHRPSALAAVPKTALRSLATGERARRVRQPVVGVGE